MKKELWTVYRTLQRRCPSIANALQGVYDWRLSSVTKRIVGNGNRISRGRGVFCSVSFHIEGSENRILIEDTCFLNRVSFFIRGDRHRVRIGSGSRFNRGGSVWLEDHDGSLDIGTRTTFEDVHIGVTEPHCKVRIGDDCLFANDIDIRTGDSHAILDAGTGERLNPPGDVTIGNRVWVAAHCMILKGVSIADGCVIGAGSVVTRSIEEQGVVAAGNPARIIRRGIVWCSDRNAAQAAQIQGCADSQPTNI